MNDKAKTPPMTLDEYRVWKKAEDARASEAMKTPEFKAWTQTEKGRKLCAIIEEYGRWREKALRDRGVQ